MMFKTSDLAIVLTKLRENNIEHFDINILDSKWQGPTGLRPLCVVFECNEFDLRICRDTCDQWEYMRPMMTARITLGGGDYSSLVRKSRWDDGVAGVLPMGKRTERFRWRLARRPNREETARAAGVYISPI